MKKDISLTMNRNRFSNDVVQLDRKKAIAQKIYTIFNLSPGDVVYKDYLFAGLKSLLGENVSNVNASIMKEHIALILNNHVPEIEFMDAKITPDYDNQKYSVKLYYAIVNDTETVVQDLIIKTAN